MANIVELYKETKSIHDNMLLHQLKAYNVRKTQVQSMNNEEAMLFNCSLC